jgi:hypothetical protein
VRRVPVRVLSLPIGPLAAWWRTEPSIDPPGRERLAAGQADRLRTATRSAGAGLRELDGVSASVAADGTGGDAAGGVEDDWATALLAGLFRMPVMVPAAEPIAYAGGAPRLHGSSGRLGEVAYRDAPNGDVVRDRLAAAIAMHGVTAKSLLVSPVFLSVTVIQVDAGLPDRDAAGRPAKSTRGPLGRALARLGAAIATKNGIEESA